MSDERNDFDSLRRAIDSLHEEIRKLRSDLDTVRPLAGRTQSLTEMCLAINDRALRYAFLWLAARSLLLRKSVSFDIGSLYPYKYDELVGSASLRPSGLILNGLDVRAKLRPWATKLRSALGDAKLFPGGGRTLDWIALREALPMVVNVTSDPIGAYLALYKKCTDWWDKRPSTVGLELFNDLWSSYTQIGLLHRKAQSQPWQCCGLAVPLWCCARRRLEDEDRISAETIAWFYAASRVLAFERENLLAGGQWVMAYCDALKKDAADKESDQDAERGQSDWDDLINYAKKISLIEEDLKSRALDEPFREMAIKLALPIEKMPPEARAVNWVVAMLNVKPAREGAGSGRRSTRPAVPDDHVIQPGLPPGAAAPPRPASEEVAMADTKAAMLALATSWKQSAPLLRVDFLDELAPRCTVDALAAAMEVLIVHLPSRADQEKARQQLADLI